MACMRCSFLYFFGVWDRDYVSKLPYVWYYVVVKHAREKCESKRAYVF